MGLSILAQHTTSRLAAESKLRSRGGPPRPAAGSVALRGQRPYGYLSQRIEVRSGKYRGGRGSVSASFRLRLRVSRQITPAPDGQVGATQGSEGHEFGGAGQQGNSSLALPASAEGAMMTAAGFGIPLVASPIHGGDPTLYCNILETQ